MRPNLLKQRFAQKVCATGGWCAIPSSFSAEVLGHSGFDAVVVDLQHGMMFFDQAVGMLQAISATPAMPMVERPAPMYFAASASIVTLLEKTETWVVWMGELRRSSLSAPDAGRR